MDNIKEIPYGVADFVVMREQNLYYVDKTMYLEELERQSRFVFFIRPRRFGKSLFISMMQAYYDKAMAGRFDELFGDLWVGKHPTPLRNRYQVMYFDYSRAGGTIERLEENFNEYSCGCIDSFIDRYKDEYPERIVEKVLQTNSARAKLNLINKITSKMAHLVTGIIYVVDQDQITFISP